MESMKHSHVVPPYEERAIPEPRVLRREFERDFLAVRVDDVAAKATFGHERRMPHRLTSAREELSGTQRCWNKELFEETELLLCEVPLAFKVRPQGRNADMPIGTRETDLKPLGIVGDAPGGKSNLRHRGREVKSGCR
jgi:hypothetical protein